MSSQYIYSPLSPNHFRLLRLLPGAASDRVRVELEIYDLDRAPEYHALSYCWGAPKPTARCMCEPGAYLDVTKDLYGALECCRYAADKAIYLWVDQFCINQQDDEEKARQIPLMTKVYSNAVDVVVWLGPSDTETFLAFQLITEIGKRIIEHIRAHPGQSYYSPDDLTKVHIPLSLSLADSPEWRAFRTLLSKPWFERTWTFQELALSRLAYVRCGSDIVSWNQLYAVSETVRTIDRHLPDEASHLKGVETALNSVTYCAERIRRLHKGGIFDEVTKHLLDLGNLLKVMMPKKTSAGHDKVYGILGIADQDSIANIKIDYKASLGHVFARATKTVIAKHRDTSILELKMIHPTRTSRIGPPLLPSWIPDFRYNAAASNHSRIDDRPGPLLHGRKRSYNATGLSETRIEVDDDLRLVLEGIKVGRITALSDVAEHMIDGQTIGVNVQNGGRWHDLALSLAKGGLYEPTNESIHLAFARTRLWDCLPGEVDRKKRVARLSPLLKIPEPGPSQIITTPNGERLLKASKDDRVTGLIISCTKDQRLCIIDSTYMGTCHVSCSIDDEVWLTMGSCVPYILRPLQTGTYQFKGEAYVHGIMEGEFLIRKFKSKDVDSRALSDEEWLENLAKAIPFPLEQLVIL